MRIFWSTPAVATTVLRYLFQSCVRASEGAKFARGAAIGAAPGTGAEP